ncbi:MAG: hypothetical protein VB042_05300 [Victivallaceae bacterium]|nr:hypothetical protein [Victivallaceae bacterium]
MIITDEIKQALANAVSSAGNSNKFSELLDGISQTTVRNWLIGKTRSISDHNWEQIHPHLQSYLTPRLTDTSTRQDNILTELLRIWPEDLTDRARILALAAELKERRDAK